MFNCVNTLHQARTKSKDWKAKYFKDLGVIKQKGLHEVVKIG